MDASTKFVALSVVSLVATCSLNAQTADVSTWREYPNPAYGFAVKATEQPHETGTDRGSEYRLYGKEGDPVTVDLTVERGPVDCIAWEKWAKGAFKHSGPWNLVRFPPPKVGDTGIPISASAKLTTTIDGRVALESGISLSPTLDLYQFHECLNGRLFLFRGAWRKGEKQPEIVEQVIKSLRSLPSEAKQ